MSKLSKQHIMYLGLAIAWLIYTFVIRNQYGLLMGSPVDWQFLLMSSVMIPILGLTLDYYFHKTHRRLIFISVSLCSIWAMFRGYLSVDYYNEFYIYLLLIPIFAAGLSIDKLITDKTAVSTFIKNLGFALIIEIGFIILNVGMSIIALL
ncbi:MAG TPA: hypothetical protein VEF53_06070 [Patescibacteria group bacterium]|nr:hypothetical protein [Patescibacteria group bacterium]